MRTREKMLNQLRPSNRYGDVVLTEMGGLLTQREAAAMLTVSEKTLIALVADGYIRAVNIGRGKKCIRRAYDPLDLRRFIEDRKTVCPSRSGKRLGATASPSRSDGFLALQVARHGVKPGL